MEHFFRTALCVFVLVGCLQAAPIAMADFHFRVLLDFACNGNVTFKPPKNVLGSCLTALENIREGMEKAYNCCQCHDCGHTVETLEYFEVPSAVANSSKCMRETEGPLTFKAFVKESEEVIQQINNN